VAEPFVSVVTPFFNTAPFLAQCIESVLGQSHQNFEYLLVDNCSSDESYDIAMKYARLDSRIRVIRRAETVSQVRNYNLSLAEISPTSTYCKIVQADDTIFPECLRLMVQAFARSETIGLVSSYYLKGNTIRGSGFPYPTTFLAGKQMARFYLTTGIFVFGSPTTVMYRSELVQKSSQFFDEALLHEDTEKCMQILREWDFGFVHQVLSFLRTGNESISRKYLAYCPDQLDSYIIAQRYASIFLNQRDAERVKALSKRDYYSTLSRAAMHFRESEFWAYHKNGLKTVDQTLDISYLCVRMIREFFRIVLNPASFVARVYRGIIRASGRRSTSGVQ